MSKLFIANLFVYSVSSSVFLFELHLTEFENKKVRESNKEEK